jgi:hypothetical protein
MAFLATRPGRFEYVHTPKHGSWLNLIECAFSKWRAPSSATSVSPPSMNSRPILKGIDEMNQAPVVFRWKKFDMGIV